ncbi:MAG TPA: hypothetical protein VN783_01770, partial [Thermoanaerobaculia bacterium]|nr:hypothetical protein [Thermoanaerobaculia bacterium]
MSDSRAATWPPEDAGKANRAHVEVWAPALICHRLGLSEISPESLAILNDWLADARVGLKGLTEGRGSWNWGWMIGAARGLWLDDWTEFGALLEAQATGASEGFLGLFFGAEPLSSDYDSMRIAATLIALARGPEAIRPAALEVLRRWVGFAALGAVPWTDETEYRAANGQSWYEGPSLSPVGERSPKTSEPSRSELFCRFLGDTDKVRRTRQGWACAVADAVGMPPAFDFDWNDQAASALKLIGNARIWSTFRFVRYPEGLLVWREKRRNTLTPSAL